MNQLGGYKKNQFLKVDESGVRTFTEVLEDGTTQGDYSYKDRKTATDKAYRTPWMPVAHKIYSDKCSDLKKQTGIKDENCPAMIIRIRETTLGNNKYNMGKRQRKYYVVQELYEEPRKVGSRTFTYIPKSWFMKWNESVLAFFTRLYSARDGKRIHLPPIPADIEKQVEKKVKLGPSKKKGIVTIDESETITHPIKKKSEPRPRRGMPIQPTAAAAATEGEGESESEGEGEGYTLKDTGTVVVVPPGVSPTKAARAKIARDKTIAVKAKAAAAKAAAAKKTPQKVKTPRKSIKTITYILVDPQRGPEIVDTGISADMSDAAIMEELHRQSEPGEAELLREILTRSQLDDFSDMITQLNNKLIIDPDNQMTGELLADIVNDLKEPDESFSDYISKIEVSPFVPYSEEELMAGAEGSEGETGSESEPEPNSDTESDEENKEFAGERGRNLKFVEKYM
jgi:hypothetical protein